MKKMIALIAGMIFVPVMAFAAAPQGIVGDCVDCHTMHNSEQGANVAEHYDPTTGTYTKTNEPIANLLRMDCIACHANPAATGALWELAGGSVVPQVSQPTDVNLAGGNFRYSSADQRTGHNVIDLTPANASNATQFESDTYSAVFGAPPGIFRPHYHDESGSSGDGAGVFTTNGGAPFDQFTCAGARGCHGTRSQLLTSVTTDNGTANVQTGARRVGIAAISGAHHNSYDGYKPGTEYDYANHGGQHDGEIVADGYRFIPGLMGYGNDTATDNRWQNLSSTSHNEYAGNDKAESADSGCGACHAEGYGVGADGAPAQDATAAAEGTGYNTRASINSTIKVPGQSMSGFCATCHGQFHSMGGQNGTSGAFLRHPSDWVIPESGEYAAYNTYALSAPVARPTTAFAAGMEPSDVVTGDTDMVMCLSCHAAHATEYDYMLRFPYTMADGGTMDAGKYATIADAQAAGGCLACHTEKGVLPENRSTATP